MKTRHLFTFAFAAFALAFAGCSDDDDVRNVNSEPVPGEKGALVEGISINFGESERAHTRAYSGTQAGEGTEGMIYEAFIFAKEANPTHPRALDGDWTVIRVTADQDKGSPVTEIGGVDDKGANKDELKKAINENSLKEKQWLVQNVASFKGVRQGDYVYVIANDPNLTLSQAAELAHKGASSEDAIKGYIANINKDYLGGLTYTADAKDKDDKDIFPTGKFFMAGRKIIPVSPNVPSNGNIPMTIGLDREVAKVSFSANISSNAADAAAGKVAFQEGDGIVVARIARKASPFAEQVPDWYVPANNCVEDWPINDHALVNGAYSAFCDGTTEGSFVFDGTSGTAITNWITGTTIPAGFNSVTPAASVTEYRYSWKLKDGDELTDNKNFVYLNKTKETIYAPVFYTTPNYSNNTNSVTVICTQATYTARGVFALSDMADKYVDAALAATDKRIPVYTAAEVLELNPSAVGDISTDGVNLPNPLVLQPIAGGWSESEGSNILTKVKAAISTYGLKVVDEATYGTPDGDLDGVTYTNYKAMMDRFYVAVMIQQRLENKMNKAEGTMPTSDVTAENYGNGIPTGTTGYLAGKEGIAATDSLLMGTKTLKDNESKDVAMAIPFYIKIGDGTTQENINDALGAVFFEKTSQSAGGKLRTAFFDTKDAYEYIKGQKLYYRADVANYVGGVSNRMTERNVYYKSRGTIQSLGAKSIHDAIYSDQNSMSVDVQVNDWKLSVNEFGM